LAFKSISDLEVNDGNHDVAVKVLEVEYLDNEESSGVGVQKSQN